MSAGRFLDVVTIMSGILMLAVACFVLYHKFPDIVDEFRVYFGKERLYTTEKRQPTEADAPEKDIEAARPQKAAAAAAAAGPCTPTKDNNDLRLAPTMESPESLVDDDSTVDQPRQFNHNNNISICTEDDYVAKFLKHRIKNVMPSPSDKSAADSCSVYLDASYNDQESRDQSTTLGEPVDSPFSKVYAKAKFGDVSHDYTLDYSVDTADNKESFSSFARPNMTMTSNMLDDTTCVEEENTSSKLAVSLFSSKHNDSMLASNFDDEEEPPRMEDVSLGPAGISKDPYSPLGRRNVTFSSQLLDDTCMSMDCSRDLATKQYEDSMAAADTNTIRARRVVKPNITIVTHKSILDIDSEEDDDSDDDDGLLYLNQQKDVTPAYTVSTAGLWSPSSDTSSAAPPSEGPSDESFGSDYNDVVRVEVEGGPDTSGSDKDELSPAAHNVHVCKSVACTACRHPQQNTPTFVLAKNQKVCSSTTGEHGDFSLPRAPPKRWWDVQHTSKLKQYVSSSLLPTSNIRRKINPPSSLEEHPFDEA